MNADQYPQHIPESGSLPELADTQVTDAATKEKYRQLFQRGLVWLGAGAVLMVLSFAINLLLFHSDTSFSTTMYILTSLGAACMVKGIADIMGF